MTSDFITYILLFGLVILFAFIIDYRKSIKYWYVLLLFLLIGFVDNSLNTITIAYPDTQISGIIICIVIGVPKYIVLYLF